MTAFRLWIPPITMLLVSFISYVDRNTLALLSPTILAETNLNGEQYGWIISAFSVAYMIGNPIWGRLLDRFGLAAGMAAAVAFWTVASASHAFAAGFLSFAIARAALGFGEGATFPGGLRTVIQTMPPKWHSRAIAIAYSGGSLGAVLTPPIIKPIAEAYGWRGAFWFTGLVGLLWLCLWAWVSRRPDIRRLPEKASSKGTAPSWTNPFTWSFMAVYALGALPLAFVLYNAPLYLGKVMKLSQSQIGSLLWIPPLGWEAGYFVWAWAMDRAGLRSGGDLGLFRHFFFALTILSLPLAAAPITTNITVLMLQLFFAMFIAAGFVIVSIAYATRSFSGEHAGLVGGLGAGSWAAAVALVMPVFGRLFDQNEYHRAFLIAAMFPIAGFAIWYALHRAGVARLSHSLLHVDGR